MGDAAAVQKIAFSYPIFATGAFWNSNFYVSGSQGPLTDFVLNAAIPQMTLSASSAHVFGFGGSIPSVSAAGDQNGILWTLDNSNYCVDRAPACGAAVLYAHDASNISTELWNSSSLAADAAGNAVKFTVPTVANGKVYVGTRGNNTGGAFGSTSTAGELDVYGLRQSNAVTPGTSKIEQRTHAIAHGITRARVRTQPVLRAAIRGTRSVLPFR